MTASLDDYHWLVSDAARPWLAELAEAVATPATVAMLRKELSPQRTHLALAQVELRRRGREKFPAAERMFFTRRSLEQATDAWTAAYKATLAPAGAPRLDLCCGCGGDLLALAAPGGATGVDADPLMTLLAAANLRACELAGETIAARVDDIVLAGDAAWHLDPDRRPADRRTAQPEGSQPSVAVWRELFARSPHGSIKLAPAAAAPDDLAAQCERVWLSRGGECKQQLLLGGGWSRRPGRRSAVTLDRQGVEVGHVVDDGDDVPPAFAHALGRYLYDPDAAVLAAGLVGPLARRSELQAADDTGGYLTGDRVVGDGVLAAFETLDVLPHDQRRLQALLRERKVGRLELKQRGARLDLPAVRKSLKLAGDDAATAIFLRRGGRVWAVLCRRV